MLLDLYPNLANIAALQNPPPRGWKAQGRAMQLGEAALLKAETDHGDLMNSQRVQQLHLWCPCDWLAKWVHGSILYN